MSISIGTAALNTVDPDNFYIVQGFDRRGWMNITEDMHDADTACGICLEWKTSFSDIRIVNVNLTDGTSGDATKGLLDSDWWGL